MDSINKTVIGKDVIESLTIGMYDDSRFIYREYIQNAADQIDKARQQGLVKDGEIHIRIDAENKTISIEDDATGIEESKVIEILKNIAQSTKQRGVDKGFRGIGRLGGLGYCEKIVFETSFKGEAVKSIMVWDAKLLKSIINDRMQKEEAAEVIDKVTTLEKKEELENEHYFKVTMLGVTNRDLLNVKEIREYLSMVAPVPFSKSFLFSKKIYDELKNENIIIDEYKTYINTEQLFKGYTGYIYKEEGSNKKKIDEITDVHFFKDYDKDDKMLFWGWYGTTNNNQSLNQANFARGFRLRKANIQIGNEDTLTKFHRDKRFQFYFFGEIYGLHSDLIPNARRDNFSETATYYEYENKLKSFFHTTIHKLCYAASDVNTAVRAINIYNESAELFEKKKNEKGFVDKKEENEYKEILEKQKEGAIRAQKKLKNIQDKSANESTPILKIIEKATLNNNLTIKDDLEDINEGKTIYRTDKLSKLNKEQRKFLSNIFSVIKNVLPKETAELLIQKIEEEYK